MIDLLEATDLILEAPDRDPKWVVLAEVDLHELRRRAQQVINTADGCHALRFWQDWVRQLVTSMEDLVDAKRAMFHGSTAHGPGCHEVAPTSGGVLALMRPSKLAGHHSALDSSALAAVTAAPVVTRLSAAGGGLTILRVSAESARHMKGAEQFGVFVLGPERPMTAKAWELFADTHGKYPPQDAYEVCADAHDLLDGDAGYILRSLVAEGIPASELLTTALTVSV